MRYFRSLVVAATAALVPTAAVADGVSIQLQNNTSRMVSSLSAFPIGEAGEIIEDNIGGHYDPVPPRESAVFTVTGTCGEILVLILFEGGSEHRARLNSCQTRKLTLEG